MVRPLEVIDEHGPGNAIIPLVAAGVVLFLLERPVRGDLRSGMGLADRDVDELDPVSK
jgi:hypothetical protein